MCSNGNCFAFDRVLKDIRQQGTQHMVCLGDALQGGAQPAETLARLRELHCPVVMGNSDAWLMTGQETSAGEDMSEQQRAVRAWSLAQLSETDLAFVRQFPGGFDAGLLTGGHTHTQQLRRLGNSWYVNPGGASLAYNWELSDLATGQMRVDPWADYAIVSSEGACLGITFRHVPFDVDELVRLIRASGKPYTEEVIALYRRES